MHNMSRLRDHLEAFTPPSQQLSIAGREPEVEAQAIQRHQSEEASIWTDHSNPVVFEQEEPSMQISDHIQPCYGKEDECEQEEYLPSSDYNRLVFEQVLLLFYPYRYAFNMQDFGARSRHVFSGAWSISSGFSLSRIPDMQLGDSPASLSNPPFYEPSPTHPAVYGKTQQWGLNPLPRRLTLLHQAHREWDSAVWDLVLSGADKEVVPANPQQRGLNTIPGRVTDLDRQSYTAWDTTVWDLVAAGAEKEAVYPGHDPLDQSSVCQTPVMGLYEACKMGEYHIVGVCLERGADLECPNSNGDYPLHIAARNGHHETVQLLLEWRADIEARNPFMETPLHLAAMNGHDQTVRVLLSFGADTDARTNCGDSPLYVAAGHGQLQAVVVLVEAGADIEDARDFTGVPLHIAASNSLHIAASNGHHQVVAFLLRSGAGNALRTRTGWTPLHCAASRGRYWAALELLRSGAEMEAEGTFGDSPLHLAAGSGNYDTIRLLLYSGADIEAKNNSGDRPLHAAARTANRETLRVLLLNGADIEEKNDFNECPLHVAVDGGEKGNVAMLLCWKADRKAMDWCGRTPLGIAFDTPDSEMQQLLWEA